MLRNFTLLALLTSCFARDPATEFQIRLKQDDVAKLQNWIARNQGDTSLEKRPSFEAEILIKGKVSSGRIRLRGDLASHWKNAHQSWRVDLPGENAPEFNQFDLTIADDKAYELELVGYAWASQLGIPTPRARLTEMQLNDQRSGHYLLSETWNQQAFQDRGWRSATIIQENDAWLTVLANRKSSLYKTSFMTKAELNPLALEPAIYRTIDHSTFSQLAMTRFARMLHDMKLHFHEPQRISWEQHVNVEQSAKWAALVLYLGSEHAILGDNVRWLTTNANLGRFEPLLYDVLPYRRYTPPRGCLYDRFSRMNHWISLWLRHTTMRGLIFKYWKELSANGAFDFARSWNTSAASHGLVWSKEEKAEREKIYQTILLNVSESRELAKHDFCVTAP